MWSPLVRRPFLHPTSYSISSLSFALGLQWAFRHEFQKEAYTMNHEDYEKAARYWTDKEAQAKRLSEGELRQRLDAFFAAHNTCALACAWGDFVRCTPLEYAWRDDAFWIFSEGGLKFRALEHNANVSLAVFDNYGGFGTLESAQVTGVAQIVDPESDAFEQAAGEKGIKGPALQKVRGMLHLIKVEPRRIDYLCSKLKDEGYSPRQWLERA